jgi:hypothetical protein
MVLSGIALPLTCLFSLVLCSPAILAQEFSADMVHSKPAGALPGRVFVKNDKIRFETRNGERSSVVILNMTEQTGFMLLPDSKMYTALQPGRTAVALPLFRPANPENACGAWEKYVNKPASCEKVGEETLNGRAAVKYKGISRRGDSGLAWIDRKLNFVVKWEGQAGAAELRNIHEGPQSTELFQVPKDYEKMETNPAKPPAGNPKPQMPKPPSPKPQNR